MLGLGLSLAGGGGARGLEGLLGPALLGLWDAERAETLTLAGSSVSAWRDLVGGHVMAQANAAARPMWSAGAYNGRPGLVFDGEDDCLEMAGVPFPTGAAPCEIWALVDQAAPTTDAASRGIFNYGDTGPNRRGVLRTVTSGANRAICQVGDGTALQTATSPGDFSGRHMVRAVVSSTQQRVDLDGVVGANVAAVPATLPSRTRIGSASSAAPANFWRGSINLALVTSPLRGNVAAQVTRLLMNRSR